jgi:hypothetical protein
MYFRHEELTWPNKERIKELKKMPLKHASNLKSDMLKIKALRMVKST